MSSPVRFFFLELWCSPECCRLITTVARAYSVCVVAHQRASVAVEMTAWRNVCTGGELGGLAVHSKCCHVDLQSCLSCVEYGRIQNQASWFQHHEPDCCSGHHSTTKSAPLVPGFLLHADMYVLFWCILCLLYLFVEDAITSVVETVQNSEPICANFSHMRVAHDFTGERGGSSNTHLPRRCLLRFSDVKSSVGSSAAFLVT